MSNARVWSLVLNLAVVAVAVGILVLGNTHVEPIGAGSLTCSPSPCELGPATNTLASITRAVVAFVVGAVFLAQIVGLHRRRSA